MRNRSKILKKSKTKSRNIKVNNFKKQKKIKSKNQRNKKVAKIMQVITTFIITSYL